MFKVGPRILLSFPLAWALIGYGQQGREQDFSSLVSEATQAQSKRDFRAAAEDYKKAVRLRPGLPRLWADLGLMQEGAGDDTGAIASFSRALALNPALYVPNLFLGIAYTRTNQPQRAIPFLVKAESLNQQDAVAALSLGRAYAAEKDYGAAESAFLRALKIDDKNSSAWFALGLAAINAVDTASWKLSNEAAGSPWAMSLFADALYKQSRVQEAISEEKTLIARAPDFPCAHAQLGFLYLAEGQNAAALDAFKSEATGCALADLGRARLNLQEGNPSASLASLSTLWKQDAGFVRSHLNLLFDGLSADRASAFSAVLNEQNAGGDVDGSLYSILSAILRDGSSSAGFAWPVDGGNSSVKDGESPAPEKIQNAEEDAGEGRYGRCTADLVDGLTGHSGRQLLLLARCAYMNGDYDRSATASDLVLSRTPKDPEALYWVVKANEELAFVALGRFEELNPDSERTHLLLGDMYRQRELYQQAASQYKAAAALAPQDVAPLFGLASVYNQDSNVDLALATAKTALAMKPNDPDLNILVAQILVTQHNWTEAEECLKRAAPGARPEMLPHLHFLLGEIYENTGRTEQAVSELRMALPADEDGSAYYQLAQIYKKLGNKAAAETAMARVRELQQKRHERALIVVRDLGDAGQNEAP